MYQFENQPAWSLPIVDQVHRAGDQHGHDDAQGQGDFVADHLGRLAHRPVERPFRARGVAAQDHAEDFQARHGEDEEHGRVEAQRHPAVGERQGQEHGRTWRRS